MRIGVVGSGTVGGILAAHLARSGENVSIVEPNREILGCARGEGFQLLCPAGSCGCENKPGSFSAKTSAAFADFAEAGPLDLVFLCTKTYLQQKISGILRGSWKQGAICVSFQNGIDPEEDLAEFAGRDRTLRVVVNYAGSPFEKGSYRMHWFNPPNYIG